MSNYHNKTVFITGAGSGIGRALALECSARGAHVAVADLNLQAAQKVALECGPMATAFALDVRSPENVKTCIESFAQQHGRLDYIFNNAGIGIAGEAEEIPLAAWQRVMDINVYGVLHGVLAAYPIMLKQGFGHIINCASLAGLGPAPLLAPYALSKHAVVGLSTSLHIEAATKGVRVSVLCPSAIETPLLDTGNPGEFQIPWAPNMRRFLTALAGPPYPVEKCVKDALRAIDKNQGIIVLPGLARIAWRLGRLSHAVVEWASLRAVKVERDGRK
jgi:NAD(P)-dependent dehydrogenase (short-subunit alcohol dehydrogenase family)